MSAIKELQELLSIPPGQRTPEMQHRLDELMRQQLAGGAAPAAASAAPARPSATTARAKAAQAVEEARRQVAGAPRAAEPKAKVPKPPKPPKPSKPKAVDVHGEGDSLGALLAEALRAGLRSWLPERAPERTAKEAVEQTYGRVNLGAVEGGTLAARASPILPLLPWVVGVDEERRYRRTLLLLLLLLLAVSLLVTFVVPRPPMVRAERDQIPPRLAKLLLEQRQPKVEPPPPAVEEAKPEEKPKEEPKKAEEKPKEEPKAPDPDRVQAAREKASKTGLLALRNQLAKLAEEPDLGGLRKGASPFGGAPITGSGSRDVITGPSGGRSALAARATQGSGGIAGTTEAVAGDGAGLGARETTQVTSTINTAEERRPKKPGGKAERTSEEIQLVFDRHKGAIYALYNRALRQNPSLKGRVVLELEISPDGSVAMARVVSSELGDQELENKLVARIKLINFGERDVAPWKNTYHIDFVPS